MDQRSSLPSFSVEGKVTIVTGASRGIGNALARGFAASGAPVVLAARSAIDLETTVGELESRGGKALAVPTDVTDEGQVSEMVRRTQAVFGHIDVLINCAGGTGADRSIPILGMDVEVWKRVMDLNLKSTHLCCQAVGRVMADQMSGSIVNFSSATGVRPTHGMTHYGSAKAGINQLTRMLSVELGRYNIRVNAISPGLIDIETERRYMPLASFEKYSRAVPLGRVGQPSDILGLALFLASDASAYISGGNYPSVRRTSVNPARIGCRQQLLNGSRTETGSGHLEATSSTNRNSSLVMSKSAFSSSRRGRPVSLAYISIMV